MSPEKTIQDQYYVSHAAQRAEEPWSTGRTDLRSFTFCPETGKDEEVVYVYRGSVHEQRIPVFGKNARRDAEKMADSVNQAEEFRRHVGAPTFEQAKEVIFRTKAQDEATIEEQFNTVKSQAKELSELRESLAGWKSYDLTVKEAYDKLKLKEEAATEFGWEVSKLLDSLVAETHGVWSLLDANGHHETALNIAIIHDKARALSKTQNEKQ